MGAGMCTPRSHTYIPSHTPQQTHLRCVQMQMHTHFTLFLLHSAELCDSNSARQEYKCKKGAIVELAKYSAQLFAQFLRWGSLKSLKQQNMNTEGFQRHKYSARLNLCSSLEVSHITLVVSSTLKENLMRNASA